MHMQSHRLSLPPACPLCTVPISGVLRYGRPLAKCRLDVAEGKWLAAAGRQAEKGRAAIACGRAAAAKLSAAEGAGTG